MVQVEMKLVALLKLYRVSCLYTFGCHEKFRFKMLVVR